MSLSLAERLTPGAGGGAHHWSSGALDAAGVTLPYRRRTIGAPAGRSRAPATPPQLRQLSDSAWRRRLRSAAVSLKTQPAAEPGWSIVSGGAPVSASGAMPRKWLGRPPGRKVSSLSRRSTRSVGRCAMVVVPGGCWVSRRLRGGARGVQVEKQLVLEKSVG